MRNIKLTLAYDGTDFRGWQIQPGQSTVQGSVSDAIEKLTQFRPTICGAGRTDAGVHAAGQVANFKTESALAPDDLQRALNALLPPSIRVMALEDVALDFHARWNAVAKTYRYRIFRGQIVPPFAHRYVHHDSCLLDFAAMVEAARRYEGEHDYSSFAASTGSEENDRERITTRTIYSSKLTQIGDGKSASAHDGENVEWVYTVRGKSFLRYMVRTMVGTLVDIGKGKLKPDEIPKLFEARDRSECGATMPPQGLCMMGVEYASATISAAQSNVCVS